MVDNDRDSLTIVHKGNIMKFTEGAFKEWAYEVAAEEFGATLLDGGPWMQFKNPKTGKNVVVKDAIADAMLQQILLRPAEYDVIATLNLNGDYLSDALAAEVGGIGIAPGPTCRTPWQCSKLPTVLRLNTRAGSGQPWVIDPVGGNDAAAYGLGRAADLIIKGHQRRDFGQDRDL